VKIKQKVRDKYAWYLSLARESEPRPLIKVPYDETGVSAILSFHCYETYGGLEVTNEPLLLERYLAGKVWHGVTVQNVAESFAVDRLIFSKEIKENYPEWVATEIFLQAEKIAQAHYGYVPTFIKNRKDLSEL
jgi:hypothetical protein